MKNSVCFFVHHDKNDKYSKEDKRYVEHLCSIFDNVVILTGNTKKFKTENGNPEFLLKIKNRGFDFGKLQHYINSNREHVLSFEDIYVFNNSCYLVRDLTPSLQKMKEKDLDYWGFTSSIERKLHIQSYFYYLSKRAFIEFDQMLAEVDPYGKNLGFDEVINGLEIQMLDFLIKKGMKCDSFIRTHKIKRYPFTLGKNPTIFGADYLLFNSDYPFLKKKLFTDFKLHTKEYFNELLSKDF